MCSALIVTAPVCLQTADDDPNRGIFGKTRVNFTQYGRSVWRLPSKEDRVGYKHVIDNLQIFTLRPSICVAA